MFPYNILSTVVVGFVPNPSLIPKKSVLNSCVTKAKNNIITINDKIIYLYLSIIFIIVIIFITVIL